MQCCTSIAPDRAGQGPSRSAQEAAPDYLVNNLRGSVCARACACACVHLSDSLTPPRSLSFLSASDRDADLVAIKCVPPSMGTFPDAI